MHSFNQRRRNKTWTRTYSTVVNDVLVKDLWDVWADVNCWSAWQDDIEYAKLTDEFKTGNHFLFKSKGAPKAFKLLLSDVQPLRQFTDVTHFFGATMHDDHELIERDEGVEIKTTINIEGPLAWVWRKIVAEGIVKSLPEQTDNLIKRTRALNA